MNWDRPISRFTRWLFAPFFGGLLGSFLMASDQGSKRVEIKIKNDCSLSEITKMVRQNKNIHFDQVTTVNCRSDSELWVEGVDSKNREVVIPEHVILKCDESGLWRIAEIRTGDP